MKAEESEVEDNRTQNSDSEKWDSLLFIEQAAFENGKHDASKECAEEGLARLEGYRAGYLRGYALGLEVGFMEGVMSESTTQLAINEEGLGGGNRQAKRSTALLTLIKELPSENVETEDFDSKLREMRSLYKLCGSPAGPFLRNSTKEDGGLGW